MNNDFFVTIEHSLKLHTWIQSLFLFIK